MKTTITINNETLEVASNAFTPILYRQLFHKDFLQEITGFKSLVGKKADDYTEEDLRNFTERSEAFARIAFVMAKQAEIGTAAELMKLKLEDFYEFLFKFDQNTFTQIDTLTSILAAWQGNAEDSRVEAKN